MGLPLPCGHHQSCILKLLQVSVYRGLVLLENLRQLSGGHLFDPEKAQDLATCLI